MTNEQIADQFSLLSKLMDIHGENSFKTKTYANAAFQIEKLEASLAEMPANKIASQKGIGESVSQKIQELLNSGRLQILDELLQATPPGVLEMLNIKGIGPKKIHTIWKEMEIETVGELLYACNENRLILYKGFGEKTQQNVKDTIEFYLGQQGFFLYAQAEPFALIIQQKLNEVFPEAIIHSTGAYRMQALTLEEISFVITASAADIQKTLATIPGLSWIETQENILKYQIEQGPRLWLYCCTRSSVAETLFNTSSHPAFIEAFKQQFPAATFNHEQAKDDQVIFESAGIAYIPAYAREHAEIIEQAKQNKIPSPIQVQDIKGIIHSHSKWSDGYHTLEQMAVAAKQQGFEYLVISDHSRSAGYANGLSIERIAQQHAEIDALNQQLHPFRIFKSIESDILIDGSLDYPDEVLASFDLVIASVHSVLKMSEEKAMARLMKAIENPYTTILGHMTGRLLLSRSGYPVDHKAIIDACAANYVAIELNAHPRRLDMDWQWLSYAQSKNVLISIDPDSHAVEGYADIKYGVLAAQKGLLTAANNLSSFSKEELENYITATRKAKGLAF